jgi:hypothetical protein
LAGDVIDFAAAQQKRAISLGPGDAALAVWENERLARVEAAEFVA